MSFVTLQMHKRKGKP